VICLANETPAILKRAPIKKPEAFANDTSGLWSPSKQLLRNRRLFLLRL
jgi:hypothetical protein